MQNYVIYGINGLVVIAAIVGVILGKITWYEAAALAAALLVPSAGHVALSARAAREAEPPPPKGRKPPIPRLPMLTLTLLVAAGGLGSTCRSPGGADAGPPPPSTAELVEAGITVVNSTCALLEGVTQSLTVVSICATLEEVATIATFVSQFLKRELPYADAAPLPCTPLPGTEVCATREELGRGIVFVLAKRRARFLMPDAGVRQ